MSDSEKFVEYFKIGVTYLNQATILGRDRGKIREAITMYQKAHDNFTEALNYRHQTREEFAKNRQIINDLHEHRRTCDLQIHMLSRQTLINNTRKVRESIESDLKLRPNDPKVDISEKPKSSRANSCDTEVTSTLKSSKTSVSSDKKHETIAFFGTKNIGNNNGSTSSGNTGTTNTAKFDIRNKTSSTASGRSSRITVSGYQPTPIKVHETEKVRKSSAPADSREKTKTLPIRLYEKITHLNIFIRKKIKIDDLSAKFGFERSSLEFIFKNIVQQFDDKDKFDRIYGLDSTKLLLSNLFLNPKNQPEAFKKYTMNRLKGVLLFGPPGNGKNMLIRALSYESKQILFKIDFSNIYMDSLNPSQLENLLDTVFYLARYFQPSIVLIDKIEHILPEFDEIFNHETHQYMRSKIKSELKNIWNDKNSQVLFVGISNSPMKIETSLLSYLPIRLHVQKPNEALRLHLLRKFNKANGNRIQSDVIQSLSRQTRDYSMFELVNMLSYSLLASDNPDGFVTEENVLESIRMIRPTIRGQYDETLNQWLENFGPTDN